MVVQKRIAQYLSESGITQAFICKKTGMSPKRVSDILTMKTRMRADEYESFCKALGKTPNDFMEVRA